GCSVDRIKLLDFGAARSGRRTTLTGVMVGTLAYMAPEQVHGSRSVDARADVFSLGAVFFECLTGRPAFAAENVMALLAKILADPSPRVSELELNVPGALDELVARMLAKDAADRPSNAGEIVEALADIAPTALLA